MKVRKIVVEALVGGHRRLRGGALSTVAPAVGGDRRRARPALPGDEMVRSPHFNFTRAITIHARPEEIWPWLVQLGYGRAGWYSYDLLDNLGRPSAERIIPELQQLRVRDWISMGGKPRAATAMRVKAFEPNRWLLWEHQGLPWVWALKPIDQETTRLITRGRNRYTWKDWSSRSGRS